MKRSLAYQLILIASFILFSQVLLAQARAQADVSITSVNLSEFRQVPNRLSTPENATIARPVKSADEKPMIANADAIKCSITVHNENDDDAQSTMLLVVVPVEVKILSNPSGGMVSPGNNNNWAGYIVFSLGNMTVGQNKTVEFTFSKSKYGNKVGAYAYSASPDPNPANNYKDAAVR